MLLTWMNADASSEYYHDLAFSDMHAWCQFVKKLHDVYTSPLVQRKTAMPFHCHHDPALSDMGAP